MSATELSTLIDTGIVKKKRKNVSRILVFCYWLNIHQLKLLQRYQKQFFFCLNVNFLKTQSKILVFFIPEVIPLHRNMYW